MERPCPELWLVGEVVEIARFDLGPNGVVIFWLCSVCGKWHGKWRKDNAELKIKNEAPGDNPETRKQTG